MGGVQQYVQFGFVLITVANLVVIIVMLVVFALSVTLRFPGERREPTIADDATGKTGEVQK
jgi:hypothetical protein